MSLLEKAKRDWGEFSAIGAATHASSIAYYTFLSLVPLLALCISLISIVGISEQDVYGFLTALVPSAFDDLAVTLVSDAFELSGLAFSLSTLSLLWTASKGAKALRAGLNVAYAEQETRGMIAVTAISIAAVVAMGALIAAAMWIVFGNSVLNVLSRLIPGLEPHNGLLVLVDLVATLGIGMLIMMLSYTYLPAGKRRFVAQLPGAAFALLGYGVLSFGFRLYVEHSTNATMLYGSMATVALLLFWFYLVFYLIIAGAFINRHLQAGQRGRGRLSAPDADKGDGGVCP